MELFVEVGLPLAIPSLYYRVPLRLQGKVEVGKGVVVGLRGRRRWGVVLSLSPTPPPGLAREDIKEVEGVEEGPPVVTPRGVELLRWAASHYLTALGLVVKAALPPGIASKRRTILKITPRGEEALRRIGEGGQREVLQALKRRPLSLKTLEARFPPALLENLLREGLIAPKGPSGGEPFVELIHPPKGDLSPEESRLVTFLEGRGEIPLRELKKRFKGVKKAVDRLSARGVLRIWERDLPLSLPLVEIGPSQPIRRLTPWQESALRHLRQGLREGGGAYLLFGVTGSGKTEVYLRAVEETLARGKGALILVPEISLTPQLFTRFRQRIRGEVALLHSAMTRRERYEQWRLVASGRVRVVIGARSALFAPVKNLGLIVVDEEHDPSYKQSEGFRYNARDLALVKGRLEGATVILGSATPSIESFHNAIKGKLSLLDLPKRVDDRPLPPVQVVDMKGQRGVLSGPLKDALKENFSRGGQAILFLNRRGFAPFLICRECGTPLRCRHCSVTLTYHASSESLRCHYCGYSLKAPQLCPNCGGRRLVGLGFGTERVAAEVSQLLPTARVVRMDSDTVSTRRDYERILRGLAEGEIDVLVGTQMVVKGHDFPRITLVGVVSADTALNLPDFRSAERTFQILDQAAGRAGRGEGEGRVVVQTLNPGHYAITTAARHDYRAFYRKEIAFRKELSYPPFCRLILVRLVGGNRETVKEASEVLARDLEGSDFEVLGPAPAPLEQIRGRWRWHLLLKGTKYTPMREALRGLPSFKKVKVEVDVDPLSML